MRKFVHTFLLVTGAALALISNSHAQDKSSTPQPAVPQEAWLGVYVKSLPESLRAQLQVGKSVGLLVEEVVPESPAAKAGFQVFDVLLAFGDQKLFNRDQFQALVIDSEPGSKAEFTVIRAGETLEMVTQLGSRDIKKDWKTRWDDLEVDANIREMLESITENPEVKAALSEAEGEIAELIRSVSESLPTEEEIKENIGAALQALRESGAVIRDIDILGGGEQIEIHVEPEEKVMRRSRILSDATEVNYSDRHGKIQVSSTEGTKTLRITDAEESVIYEGPLTEKALQGLERRDRERLKNLLEMHEIKLSQAG